MVLLSKKSTEPNTSSHADPLGSQPTTSLSHPTTSNSLTSTTSLTIKTLLQLLYYRYYLFCFDGFYLRYLHYAQNHLLGGEPGENRPREPEINPVGEGNPELDPAPWKKN